MSFQVGIAPSLFFLNAGIKLGWPNEYPQLFREKRIYIDLK